MTGHVRGDLSPAKMAIGSGDFSQADLMTGDTVEASRDREDPDRTDPGAEMSQGVETGKTAGAGATTEISLVI